MTLRPLPALSREWGALKSTLPTWEPRWREWLFTWLAAERGRLTWVTRGWGRTRETRGCWKELSIGLFLFCFCLALSCRSVLFKPHNEVQSCRRVLLLRPSTPSSSFSLHHIISHLNRILAEWSWGRWNWIVHRPLTILRLQEISCPLCLCYGSLVELKANILSKLQQSSWAALSCCLFITRFPLSHCLAPPLSTLGSLVESFKLKDKVKMWKSKPFISPLQHNTWLQRVL